MAESGFWRFSLAFYRRPGVAQACLELQDRAGADVNVLLYLLFLASRGRQVNADEVATIEAVASVWRDAVVAPLREVRRKLKHPLGAFDIAATANLRTEVMRIELAAERIQQEVLESLIPLHAAPAEHAEPIDAARANLAGYCVRLPPQPEGSVQIILDAFARYMHD